MARFQLGQRGLSITPENATYTLSFTNRWVRSILTRLDLESVFTSLRVHRQSARCTYLCSTDRTNSVEQKICRQAREKLALDTHSEIPGILQSFNFESSTVFRHFFPDDHDSFLTICVPNLLHTYRGKREEEKGKGKDRETQTKNSLSPNLRDPERQGHRDEGNFKLSFRSQRKRCKIG